MKAQEKQTVADKDEYRWYSTPWVNNSAVPKHAPNSLPKLGGSGDRILPPTIDLCQLQLSLGILQLDPADRAVIKIADRRDAIQKKAFTNWVNHHLSKRNCWVHDLFVDLRNGYLLVRLLESLTNELLGFEFIESRLHWIQNVQRVLNFLRYRGIRIVNIRADEIVDGNPKLTLGLIWIIILHFQVTEVLQNQTGVSVSLNTNVPVDEVAKQSLLNWCRAVTTGYPGVFVRDFSTSWLDGRGFLTLIHRYRPELVDFHVVDRQSPAQNLELAFTLAERELHVVRLFDAEDLASTTDERSIITYIASLYEALATDSPSIPPLPALYRESVLEPVSLSHGSVVGHLPSDQSSALRTQWLEYRSLATELAQWLRLTTDRMNARNFPPDLKGVEQRVMGEIKRHRLEERPRRERERQQLIRMSEDLKPGIRAGHIPNDPFLRIEQINRLWDEYNTALEERELAALSDMRRLDRLQWAADRIVRECRAVESQLTALERRLVETEPSVTTMVDSQRGGRLCRWSEQLGALETKLNGLFNQVQHLRSGRYVHTEQIYRDVCTLHQRFLDLQRRLRQQSNPSEPNGTKALNSSQVNLSHPAYLPKGLAPGCQDQRYEFLTPIQRCLVWIDEHVNLVKDGSYGNSIQSVEAACRKHEQTIREVAYFRNEIERCRKSQLKATRTPEEKKLSEESMQTLDHAYQQLLEMCDHRTRLSHSLLDFVRRATHQLDWLRAHEASEVHRDWSRPDQLNSGEIRRTLQELVKELKLREPGFSDLSVAGTSMQLDNHPASDLIQAYVIALERHWAWLVQLIGCSESRLEQLMRQESHTSQVAECESILTTQLHDMQLLLGRSCKRSSTMEVDRLRTQLQHIATQLNDYESLINGLMVEAQDIVPLSVDIDESASPGSSLDHRHIGSRVRPLCCFRSADYWFDKPNTTYESVMGETFWPKGSDAAEFDKGDALVLVGTTDTKMSNLRTATGTCLQTPIVCFLPSWPCAEAIERTRYLMNFLNKVKSCLTLADLSLRGEVLCACMNAWRDGDTNQPFTVEGFEEAKRIYVDGLRHSLALRLANQPSDEIERFETELARFDNLLTSTSVPPDQTESVAYSELRQVMGQLRRAVNTLASQLQQRCASSLPDRISELERRIQEHKAWVKDLAHIQSRSLEFQQKLQRSENLTLDGQASPIIIQAQALGDTASQLHVAGQAYSQLLADTDAWLARLNRADEVLGECELSLLGSAIHIHGLFPSLGTLEPANHDGLRAESVERAHKDLKAIAERLPRVRAELDLLSQQVPDVNKLTLSENRDPHVTREFLRLLLPVDNQVLLPRLNICHQRLAAAMREVELELKAFGDSLRCFPTYQSLHDDLLHQSTEFKNRIVELSELVRSIGLESGSDETLIKAALGQADQIAAEVDDQLVKVEQLNRHIAQMILVLTNYAKATQNYRQLVETTFQQSGASRDYRWSPGFGLFDITQILRNADQITDRYNDHAQQVYDQIQCLYNVLRHSGYGGHLQLTHVPRALTYRQIYPGEFPPEFPQRRSITPDQAFRPGSTPSIPVSLRTSGSRLPITDYTYVNGEHQTNWELRLDCIETESVVALPNGWDFPPDLNTDRAFWSRLKKPMPTSGAWFVTRLSEFDSEGCRDEPLCIGDALRRGLIDPRSQTCQPSSKASSMSISWKEAVERGWLTDQASRALSDPIRTPRGLYCPLASLILRPGEFNQTDGVDPATGNYWPEQQKLVELWMESKLSSSDFTRLAAVLSSGIAVEYRESRVCWCDASCEKQSPSMVKPCLSDWLSAGAYNPATRRLRVSILKDNSTANMEKKLFCEDELTIKQCIELGLIDPHMPEVIVPMETSSESARTTPYRRITLNTAISVGLIDDVDGLWCGISQWADVSVSLHVAHTAGLISRAPSLSEALLAGLLALDRVDENGQLRSGLVDTHTGSHMSFSEAIQRGLVQGNCPSLMLLRASHVKTHSLTEALRLGIINELGEFQLHNGSSVTLWDAVNSGLVRLVHTQVYPPPVGVLQPKLARKQQYHQHPVLQAIRTNLLDAGSEEILLSEAEAKQHGLSPTMRRILLRKSPRISHLCDVQTVNLLTRSSGLIYPDGRELTGLEALARGWLIPCSSSPPGSRQYGQVIDPTTDLAVDVVAGTTWPPTRPLSTNGAHLLLGLSSHRPYRGYLMIQRLITKLSWLGPGLHDDNLVKPTLLTNLPRVPSSTSLGHQWRPEQILSVLDPSSARHLSPSEAIRRNLLDLDSGVFRFPDTGRTISLGDAVGQKLVQVSRSKPPTATSHTDANTPDSLSITETRTYRILSVMDPATGQLINPDRAIATGLLNLNERMYMGTQPSISIDEAMNRGFVLAHGTTPVIFNSDVLLNGEPRKTVKEMNLPLTLTELIATGHIVQDSDKSCMVRVPNEPTCITVNEAVAMGILDAEHSLLRSMSTNSWTTLAEALCTNQMDGISGYVNLQPGWISILDAASRGLLSETASAEGGRVSFDEALARGLIDPVSSRFYRPNQSDSGVPSSVSIKEAIDRGWLEPPIELKKKSLHNGSASSLFGRKRPPSPSSSSIKKRPALTPLASLRKLLRSQSPGRSSVHSDVSDRTNTLSRSEKSDERSLRSKDTITNRFFAKLATLGSRSSNECPATEVEKVSKPRLQHRLELLERNCVLYAFYYLHDEVRVEAAITESMLREGRVDVRQGVVCDPLSGRFVPAPEALANGFVFGIVFTKAGRVPPESGVEDTAPDHTSSSREPLFWLEVFHRRHDIYQLERVYDPYDKKLVAVTDAVAKGVVDPIHCTYTHPVTGDLYSIEDALYCGWIQALPVGNPPPFELKGRQFDHIHVRTVEEGYTFTSITRTIPYVTIHRHFVPSPSPKLADMISDGIHTTRSLKRHMFGEPTPRMYVGTRGSGEPLPVCHLKPGYQLTPGGEVEIIATGERVSVPDAISRNYAVPATPAQSAENSQLLPESESEALVKQLLLGLDEESKWITGCEDSLLRMGAISLDDRSNRQLLDSHQDLLEELTKRQTAIRSIVFQAEQFLRSTVSVSSPATRKQLQLKVNGVRERSEHAHNEAESRIRTLIGSFDALEHLTYKLHDLQNTLKQFESVLTISSTGATMDTSQFNFGTAVQRLNAAVSEANTAQAEISNLPCLVRNFLGHVSRYTRSKNAYRESLDCLVAVEDDKPLEHTVRDAVREASDRLFNLGDRVRDRLACMLSAQEKYEQFIDEVSRHTIALDTVGKKFRSIDFGRIAITGSRLSSTQRGQVQAHSNTLVELIGLLENTGHDLQVLLKDTFPKLQISLMDAGFTQAAVDQVVKKPLVGELKRYESLISGVKQKSTELVRLLSEGQSVSDTLSSTVQCLEKVEHRLAHPVSGKTQEESTELHEAQAELSSQNVALDVARSRVQSVLKKAAGGVEAVSEADIRTAREFEKQIDILDQRLAKNQTEVECRLRDITATQETMNRCEREAKDILSWTDKTFASMDSPPFFRAPESHLRKRLQAVQSQLGLRKKQTQELGEQVRALPASFLGAKKLKENISVLEARLEQLDHRLTLAMRNLDLLDARCAPYCAARQAAEEWLITTCGVVQGLSAIALASEELSRQSAETKELLDRWKAQGDQLNEVYRLGTAYDALSHSVKHGSRGSEDSTAFEQESSDVKREMKDLRERYSTLGTQIQERQNTLEAVSKEVSALEQHRDDLVTWLGKRVQALVGQTRKLTDLQTINDASIEAQRIHDELVSGMSGLDELRKRAATLLQNRSYVAGAAELRNAVTETEHHWSTAVNAATERQRSLERLIRDVAEFKRLDGTLSQRLRQITLAARASPLIDQTTLELAPSHLKQIRSLQSELDSLTPDIVQMRELGKRLTDRLQPPVVAELQIGQQIHHVSSVHDQAQKDLALKANQYEKVLGPSFQFEQLLDDVDGILGGAQRQIDTPGISRKDRHEVEDQMNKARTLLTRARALGKQLSDSTTDAAMKFGIETKLLQMENLFNQTSRALAGPPGQDRLDGRIPLPAQTQFGALCNWMSEKSNQLEKANELLGQQFSGLGELSLDQVAQQIKVLHDTQEEIQQKRQGLQTAVSALPPEMLGTANQQLDLLSKAIAAKQTQLEKVASEPTSLTASLNQLEAWINSEIGDLTKPLATHGAFLADSTQMVATEQKLKSKSIEVRRKMEDLNSLKQKLKLPLKDIPGSMVNGLLHQVDSILLSLTRLDSEVQNRIDQIADVKRCHTQAQQAVAAYRRAVDDAETKWIDLQQARLEKRPIRVDHTGEESISTPGSPRSLPMDQMANLQAELFALLEETATTGALQTRPSPTLTMIQAMQQLEHSLKAAGDNDPRRSVTEIMNDIRATRKRIEAIIQSVNNDLGSAEASASANTTVNLIKQVNAVARQVRSAAERLSNFPEKSPGVVPKTLRERTQSVNEIKDELSHCKEVIGELQAQLQSQARAPGAPGCVAELLGQLESLDKETGSLENRAEQLESEVRNRLPKAQQMAELRQQLATSVNQARKACLPASGAALDASTGLMSAENLIKKLRDDLARMRTVSRQLSENYADEITQRQMESEIVTAEAVIAQLSEQLVAQAVGQRDQTGSLLIQVRNNLQRLQHQYDELRNDFAAQALRSATSGDCSNLRDNCRLMLTRAESCTDELNHMKTVIASLHGVQTHENMDELHKRIDQLLGNYAVFIGELKEQLKESVKAEATQKQLMDRLQEADSWLTEQRHRFNQPVYGAPEDTETGDSKMVADVRSSLKLTRSLAKEVDSKRDVFRKLKSDGDILISSKQVLDPEPIRDRLGALQDAYGDLRSGIQQRLSAFEAALPTTQRLVSALTTLGLRLPAAESRLRSLCASTSDPINLRRSGVDALEAELSNILAPQAHLVRTNWNRLQELSVPPSVFSRTLTLPDGTKSEVKHAEQIEAELHRFDKFQMQLSELATEVSSTRYKTNVLLNKLDEESRWLNSALQRLDPLASDDPAHWTGDAEEGEKNFVKLDGNALASFTDQSALLNEFPSLAVLPANYGPLSQVRDRLYHFRENWEERQKSRTQILLTEAHGLLQAAGIRVSGIADSGRTLGRHFGDKLGRQLVLAVDLLSKRMAQLDTRLGQVEVRVGEALPLSRSFYADMGEFADTMNADEAELERLSLPGKLEPRKKTELGELDNERALHKQIKTLDEKTESHKTLLDQITRTSVPLIDLVAKTNGITIRDSVRNATDRYRQLRKAVKARLTSVETRLKQSDEIAEQLDVMSDLFADVAQQASHLGIPVDPSTIWARPAATPGVELVDSPVPLTQQSGLLAEAGVGRVRPMVSVQPDQLQEHLNETRELIETLSQRLPELEALTACVRAQLEPKLAAIKTQRKAQLDSSEVVDPFAADAERAIELHKTLLRTAEKLQTDWLGLQKQLEARVAKLSAIHETSSVGFWSRVNELQAALIQAGGTLRIIATGCDPADASTRRDPLDPTSYVQQRNDLGALLQQVDHLTSQLSACQHAGAQLIQLITGASSPEDTLQLRREEEQAIRNEVNSALNELDALHKDLLTSCQRLSNHIDKQETAAKQFKMGLEDFIRWLSQQEVIWDQFAPIANETVSVLKQLEEIIAWNDGLLYKHSDLEALNWSASQLSAVDLDELGTLSMEDTVGPTSTVPSSLQSDLAGANRRWDTLLDSSNHRRHRLQTVLLGLGEFDQALDALIKWISMAQANVDQIPVRRGNIRGLEADLARVKIIQNNVNNHQLAVVRVHEQAKRRIDSSRRDIPEVPSNIDAQKPSAEPSMSQTAERLNTMNEMWEHLKASTKEKQCILEEALRETFNFHGQFDNLVRRCRQLESRIPTPGTRIMGCLPDSAREQLRRFMDIYNGLVEVGDKLTDLRKVSAALLVSASSSADQPPERLTSALDRFRDHHSQLLRRATAIRDQLQSGLSEVERFHAELAQMMQWLTSMERTVAQQKPVSRIVARLGQLILDHAELRRSIASHRDVLLSLDRMGAQVQHNAQKQDVVLVKNLLSSVHNRWEQLLSRIAERTRQLNVGLKEAQTFLNNWTTLTEWLKEQLTCLEEQCESVATRSERIAHQLTQHYEFQRALGARNVTFDSVRRYARYLRDRAPVCDHQELDDMVNELKHLWNAVCSRSLDRQRMLEQALLSAGLYKEALQSLTEWLSGVEPQLSEHQVGYCGDVDTVEHLIEAHRRLVSEVDERAGWIQSIHEAADELMRKASKGTIGQADVAAIKGQLNHLDGIWDRVQLLTKKRGERLDEALKLAVQFQEMCRSLMDYFAGAEHVIRRLAALPTYDDLEDEPSTGTLKPKSAEAPESLAAAINAHDQTHKNLLDQSERVQATLHLGNQLMAQAHPEAVQRLRQWIHAIQSRWSDLIASSTQRADRLRAALDDQKRRQLLRTELLDWIKATQDHLDREPTITFASTTKRAVDTHDADKDESQDNDQISTLGSDQVFLGASDVDDSSSVATYRTLPLNEITEPELIERLLAEHAELEREAALRQPVLDLILKHAKRRTIQRTSTLRGSSLQRGRASGRTTSRPATGKVKVGELQTTEPNFVSSSANQLYQRWSMLQRALAARRTKLRDRLTYLSEVEKMRTFQFESWRQRYVAWLNENKSRVIDLFHRKDLDHDGRLTYAEFIDGILEMKFQTTRVELQTVAEIFDANGDGYIDYRECLNALRAGYVASRMTGYNTSSSQLSLSQIGPSDEEAINCEVRRQIGLCTCHNTYQICKMATDKYRFGDSQKLRLVRILRSAVMVRVGGGWTTLDEFLAKNDPCRASAWKSVIDVCEGSITGDRTTGLCPKPSSRSSTPKYAASTSIHGTAHSFRQNCTNTVPSKLPVKTSQQRRASTASLPHSDRGNSQLFDHFDSKSLSGVVHSQIILPMTGQELEDSISRPSSSMSQESSSKLSTGLRKPESVEPQSDEKLSNRVSTPSLRDHAHLSPSRSRPQSIGEKISSPTVTSSPTHSHSSSARSVNSPSLLPVSRISEENTPVSSPKTPVPKLSPEKTQPKAP